MSKWADYCIHCVAYTKDGVRIATVGVFPDLGDTLGLSQTWHRTQVVTALGTGKTFVTIWKAANGKWKKGATVVSFTKDGETFIRTDGNDTKEDNLGSLPSC